MDLSATIHYLGDILGEVICEQESSEIFELEERIRQHAKERRAGDETGARMLQEAVSSLTLEDARAMASAFSEYFDLVNLAEESNRVSVIRENEGDNYPAPIHDSIGEAVEKLRLQGVTIEEMKQLLEALDIELVLTAHPTEAKRRTILSKLLRISEILQDLNRSGLLPDDAESFRCSILSEVTSLWLTERARTRRPDVTDEVKTGLYFIDEVFWMVLPKIYADLDEALKTHFPGLRAEHPWLHLASWIGGDRDGNPNVTVEVTAETLRLHRGLAVEKHREAFQDLSRRLSMSARQVPLPEALVEWYESRGPLSEHVSFLKERYSTEPYRIVLALLAEDLAEASRDDMTRRLLSQEPHTARLTLSDLEIPLELVYQAIPETIAQYRPLTVLRQLEIFGLRAARLDIRENSARLSSALEEVLRALKIAPGFETADRSTRKSLIADLLKKPAPTLADRPGVTRETAETLALFRLIARVRTVYGPDLLGPFIISMTRDGGDVLSVLLMARWAGCADCLDIVPLFETMEDLEAAPGILADLFSLEVYRKHLDSCCNRQMVMIGYSDSNKDGGYLAANWALYQAQERISRVCREYGIELTLFHGRGGTVARGGGPANRAIRSQPPNTINGRFRLTEQGEVIASRYGNLNLAHRHLEQIVNAVLLASAPSKPGSEEAILPSWREAMTEMASVAQNAYQGFVYEAPDFLEYWHTATPLDELSRLHIGSRPATRGSGRVDIDSIRAIPWVFSWMQSRFNLPGWFGLGSGLEHLTTTNLGLLQDMYERWPLFQTLLDNAEMSLLKADMGIAAIYSELVPDREFADRIYQKIYNEYERTKSAILAISGHKALMDGEPIVQRSIYLRNPYIDPLNYIQVEMLRRLRALSDQESEEADRLRDVIVLTINGIASGLRNTG